MGITRITPAIIFVLAALLPQSYTITIEDCPSGLHRDKYLQVRGNYCYVFMTYKSNDFDHAQRDCHSHRGSLATIRDKDTQDYLYSMLRNTYKQDEPVWIGLSDENKEGAWEWRDGSKATYTNWDDGQPGIGSTLEDCAAINMEHHGKWHDYRCNDLFIIHFDHPYICEYGPVGITTGTPTTTRTTTNMTTTTATTTPPPPTSTTTPPPTGDTVTTPPTTTSPPPDTATTSTEKTTPPPTTVTTTATTTPVPTTTTTPPATTTRTTTTTELPTTPPPTTVPASTTQPQAASTTCPQFVCPNLSCGFDGYKRDSNGCTLCECDV